MRPRPAARVLVHPDFAEFGASGMVWDCAPVVQVMQNSTGRIEMEDARAHALTPGTLLLTYTAWHGGAVRWTRGRGGRHDRIICHRIVPYCRPAQCCPA